MAILSSAPAILILAALALASCLQLVDGIHIVPTPSIPRVGQTVTLSAQGISRPTICFWFRSTRFDKSRMIFHIEHGRVISKGGAFTNRDSLGRDCALVIQGVQASDAGDYYLITLERDHGWKDALARLQVSN
ncbi:carcinoembryonic antigen-related cell adhesion molecule 16 [Rhineura floridana]|uniref:carcinoembryonic antigen-related cell adhesion molecule 16 n=1 Tax=Rhineura floridana TaxID=261503 RepID=UPI002AC873D7|nr:carcinoembryonic antigen-related cell adhesion molecule 16 [Rhineura floridana]